MDIKRIATKVADSYALRLAAQHIRNDDDIARSLHNLVKQTDGLWKSEKQGRFVLSRLRHKGQDVNTLEDDDMDADAYQNMFRKMEMAISKRVRALGALGAIFSLQGKSFGQRGGSTRSWAWVFYLDNYGVVAKDKATFKHDARSAIDFKNLEKTWDRPRAVEEGLEEQGAGSEEWFDKNREIVNYVLDGISANDSFWGRFWVDLNSGIPIPDATLMKMYQEALRTEGSARFPYGKHKMEIVITPDKTKIDTYRLTYGAGMTYYLVLIGSVEGYKEYGYIRVTAKQLIKALHADLSDFNDDEEDFLFDVKDEVLRKTITLQGTFTSNSKMIFGSRIKIISIR